MTSYLDGLFNLKGKVAAITGGGGHLCGEMARGLARAGVKVAVLDLRPAKAEAVRDEIRAAGGEAMAAPVDVTNKASFQEALRLTLDAFGRVDILVNGAGMNAPTPVLQIPEEEWEQILHVNLRGTLYGCQVFGESMLGQGAGSIINISSASAGPPLSKAFTYSVSKAGVKNLTQNLAREWATRGVRVNALRPGFFPTEWSLKNFIDPARDAAIKGHTAMKRYGQPKELLGAVLWLASDASGFVTGAEIAVDGGFSCMTI
jgi:NAD(P)-dependent dehydrogenase (short-subunit alcohol dehydrogenase family)